MQVTCSTYAHPMKRFLPALLLVLLAFSACKKDKNIKPGNDTTTTPGNTNPPTQPGQLAITKVAPTSGLPNTMVTISGSNFGTSADNVTIFFNGVKGVLQSVTPTEIKVLVPVTATGVIGVLVGNQSVSAGSFNYIYPELASAYVSGDVTLLMQADVDKFVELNKGRNIQINGSLKLGGSYLYSSQSNDITSVAGLSLITSISGQLFCDKLNLADVPFFHTLTSAGSILINSSGFKTLNFAQLRAFSGALNISNMPDLEQVQIDLAPALSSVSISTCPKLNDLSFLNGISSASTISIGSTGAASLSLDKLSSLSSSLYINNNTNLASLSCAAMTGAASISVTGNNKLTALKLPSLTSVSGKMTLANLGITDLSGLNAAQSLGALQVYGNPSLVSLNGLEKLTSLTMSGVVANTLGTSVITRVNGIYIANNPKLTSLSGLQNVTTIPIAYITGNPLLTDLCAFKKPILVLSAAASFTYRYKDQIDYYRTATVDALTLTKNGSYVTRQDALAGLAQCQ